jgi:hypothetical protein
MSSSSVTRQCSTILPSDTRSTVMLLKHSFWLVGATPKSSAFRTSSTASVSSYAGGDFAHIKDHELLEEPLEDNTSYGETFFFPLREYMSAALRSHSSSDFSRQGQQLLDEQAERIDEAGSVLAGARNPPVVYHGPVLGHPRAIAKPWFGDTSGGA